MLFSHGNLQIPSLDIHIISESPLCRIHLINFTHGKGSNLHINQHGQDVLHRVKACHHHALFSVHLFTLKACCGLTISEREIPNRDLSTSHQTLDVQPMLD